MRLRSKILIIVMLFLFFLIILNNKNYAESEKDIAIACYNYVKENYPHEGFDNYAVFKRSSNYRVFIFSDNTSCLRCKNTFAFEYIYDNPDNVICIFFDLTYRNGSIIYNGGSSLEAASNPSGKKGYYYSPWVPGDYTLVLSKKDVYNAKAVAYFEFLEEPFLRSDIFIEGEGEQVDKLNLFELNLIDCDYNEQIHQFNLSTYTNSPCYDELMDYYNNNYHYAIYLTHYERYLTYDSETAKNFQYGSYALTGYIDFLITDKSYFYFSPYYNKVLSNSGNSIFNKDVEDYTKRFYFKLVYSEDSNHPDLEIWEDNGSLILGDINSIPNSNYFIGSSQTIYYAEEKNNHDIKKLTDRVFYRGYLKRNDDDPLRDISDTPFYRYNFKFSGGVNTIFYLSDPDYENKIDSLKYLLDTDYSNRTDFSIQSENKEEYYIEGVDDTTSTFTDAVLTKDSTDQDFKDNSGEKRHPTFNNVDEEDTTNWSILDFLRGIYNTLTFKDSFDEETGEINNKLFLILDKFSFNKAIIDNAKEIKDYVVNTQETHKYYLNINHKYLNGQVCIIDLSWYEPYKPTVDSFICAFTYLAFSWHMFCMLPGLISGASATSYVNDIITYSDTSGKHSVSDFTRSSNIHKRRS